MTSEEQLKIPFLSTSTEVQKWPKLNKNEQSSSATELRVFKMGFYEVESTIGKGNYSVVKLARHRITNTKVAMKIVDKRQLDDQNLSKIRREIAVLKQIRHPNIIKLYQIMESPNMIYLITEYAPNGDIFDFISRNKSLPETEVRKKFWQIISAVEYLHNIGIVHRDLKAENLLLDVNFNVTLADFGFCNYYNCSDTLNTFCGSPPYASPEMYQGKRYLGPEVDIWSLGVVLYTLTCGSLPFVGASLPILREKILSSRIRFPFFVSLECENLIQHMLTVDPMKRPTITQIKRHKWMKAEFYQEEFTSLNTVCVPSLNISHDRLNSPSFSSSTTPLISVNTHVEPHPKILRLMGAMGIDVTKVQKALLNDSYDGFHAIYLLLLERLQRSIVSTFSSSRSFGSGNVTDLNEVLRRRQSVEQWQLLHNELRDHSTCQTTECVTISTPTPNYGVKSNYDEDLSLQSATGTMGSSSVEERVESDNGLVNSNDYSQT